MKKDAEIDAAEPNSAPDTQGAKSDEPVKNQTKRRRK